MVKIQFYQKCNNNFFKHGTNLMFNDFNVYFAVYAAVTGIFKPVWMCWFGPLVQAMIHL